MAREGSKWRSSDVVFDPQALTVATTTRARGRQKAAVQNPEGPRRSRRTTSVQTEHLARRGEQQGWAAGWEQGRRRLAPAGACRLLDVLVLVAALACLTPPLPFERSCR